MFKVRSQGILVLPFKQISELLKVAESDSSVFQKTRSHVISGLGSTHHEVLGEPSISFEITGNRVITNCIAQGKDLKAALKASFNLVFSVLEELLSHSLGNSDIENEDALIAIRDIVILGVEEI